VAFQGLASSKEKLHVADFDVASSLERLVAKIVSFISQRQVHKGMIELKSSFGKSRRRRTLPDQRTKANSTMFINAGSLIGTTLVTSFLGYAYWWLAARQFSPATLGSASLD